MSHGTETNSAGMNVGVWLSKEIAPIFRLHVPKGEASAYGAKAIEAQLRRDGYLGDSTKAVDVLKMVPTELRPLLVEFAELLAARQVRGSGAVKAMLTTLRDEVLETASGR